MDKREKMKILLGKMQALTLKAGKEKRGFNEEEQSTFDGHHQEYMEIKDKYLHEPMHPALQPDTSTNDVGLYDERGSMNNRMGSNRIGKIQYRDLFQYPREEYLDNGGFRSFGEFLMCVSSQRFDPRLKRTMGEGLGSTGGFLVPTEFAAGIMDVSLENEIVRPRCQVWPMQSSTLGIPYWSGSDHSSVLFGGFNGTWIAEHSSDTPVTPKVGEFVLSAKTLSCVTSASNELVQDVPYFERNVGDALIKALGWFLDEACLVGNGVGRPLGVLNSSALVTVNKETGQEAGTIVYKNLTKMFARLHPGSIANSVWVANSSAIPQLLELNIIVGTGGVHVPVLSQNGEKFSMLGRPVQFTEKVPSLGTKGDLMLVDFSQYALGMRREISIDVSGHVGWLERETYYRVILRADGAGTWADPVTPKNGDTLSWCVALADRT